MNRLAPPTYRGVVSAREAEKLAARPVTNSGSPGNTLLQVLSGVTILVVEVVLEPGKMSYGGVELQHG